MKFNDKFDFLMEIVESNLDSLDGVFLYKGYLKPFSGILNSRLLDLFEGVYSDSYPASSLSVRIFTAYCQVKGLEVKLLKDCKNYFFIKKYITKDRSFLVASHLIPELNMQDAFQLCECSDDFPSEEVIYSYVESVEEK